MTPEELETLIDRGRRMSLDEAVAFPVRMADELERATADPEGRADGPQ